MVGDGAATLVARAFAAVGMAARPTRSNVFSRFTVSVFYSIRGLSAVSPTSCRRCRSGAALALLTNKPLAATREILEGLDLARYFGAAVVGGDGPFPRKPIRRGCSISSSAAGATAEATMLVGDSVIDWRTARAASTAICLARYGFGFEGFPRGGPWARRSTIDAPEELLFL